ncbi:general stress protein [Actinoplanes sp. NPDC048967]|uniref:general stress protein n=1 Tax=Actinoplanes sp. NPDC048967 TaxID=3155269 RepID=UPI0033F636CE
MVDGQEDNMKDDQLPRQNVSHPARPSTTSAEPAHVGVAQRVIAVHTDHDSAVRTLKALTDAGFAEDRTTIVGRDLTFVERGTGQLSTAEVTGRGATAGFAIGGLTGWLLGLFDLVTASVATWWLIANAALLGAVLGAVAALLGYAITRGQRSFLTGPTLTAAHFDLQVDADLADSAVRMLAGRGASTTP